jgi:TATA-binding protein-associated factor Taf7
LVWGEAQALHRFCKHTSYTIFLLLQEVFEVRFAKMPEEPPQEAKETSDSSDEEDDDDDDESASEGGDESSSGDDSENEAQRATQLSYLHKQV